MENEEYPPFFDFSGLNFFWKIITKLEAGEYPNPTEWDDLFSSPGYRTLLKNEFSTEFFKEKYVQAFMPSMNKSLEKALETGTDTWYLPHYVRVRKMKDEIMKYLGSLDTTLISKSAVSAARSFLPVPSQQLRTKIPGVAFVVFKYDARGGHDPIVMDALASMEWGDLSLFLGHEFHHYFRNSLPYAMNFLNSRTIEECLVNIMISVESEGIADIINREQECSSEGWKQIQKRYKGLLEQVPDNIRYLDEWIVKNHPHFPESSADRCDALSTLVTDSGHQMGYYMSKAILRRFSKETLTATVGRPFAFFLLYQKAADEEGLPNFSEKSRNILQSLEFRYSVKNELNDI